MKIRSEWVFRLNQECKFSSSCYFVTLTYEKSPLFVCKKDCQDFLKRLRINLSRGFVQNSQRYDSCANSIRYYLISEYGPSTYRPHYHAIIFNLPLDPYPLLNHSWDLGFVQVAEVNPARIAYVTAFHVTKNQVPEMYVPNFSLKSSKPGLGAHYVKSQEVIDFHQIGEKFYTILPGGIKQSLPRYYRSKIFNNHQIKKHAKSAQNHSDYLESVNRLRCDQRGESFYLNQQEAKKQYSENVVKKLTKKSKL